MTLTLREALLFGGKKLIIFIYICETVRANKKCVIDIFVDIDICHRTFAIEKISPRDGDLLFGGKIIKIFISLKR